MKWLFVTTQFPYPLTHGTSLRVWHVAGALRAMGDDVTILSPGGDDAGVEAYRSAGMSVITAGSGRTWGKSRCALSPYVFDAELAERVADESCRVDVVVLVRPAAMQYGVEASKAAYVIADLVDDPILEAWRRMRRQSNVLRAGRALKFLVGEYLQERAFGRHIDVATFVSDDDARNFHRRHMSATAVAVPNGVDVDYFRRPVDWRCSGDPTVLFVGNLRHEPNADAAMFLIEQVAPKIWESIPDTRVVIAGCNPSQRLEACACDRVKITGFVDDIRSEYWSATVTVLPMRIGTGMKNKLLEAWAASSAVIATPRACQGLPVGDGQNAIMAASADELARAAVRMLTDATLRGRIASHGRQTVEQKLTWRQAAEELKRLAGNETSTQHIDMRSAG